MYGMLLESVQYYLTEKYGEEIWEEIRERAGITDHVFVTHQRYSETCMKKIADSAEEVLGEETDMTSDDFMQYFGSCFVNFFSHYGYDRVIRVSGRYLRDFLIGIDNLHEHMRFGYPKLQSPSFHCEGETSTGLTLHYISKRKGFMFYVVGQVKEIASSFYQKDLDIKILSHEVKGNTTHVAYRLGFDNSGYRPPSPDLLSVKQKRGMDADIFFSVFPFSFVICYDMTISMAGYGIVSVVGNRLIGNDIREMFTLRRPKEEFTWETFTTRQVTFELVCMLPTLRRPTIANFDAVDFSGNFSKENDNDSSRLWAKEKNSSKSNDNPQLHLRGIMKYIKVWNSIIYICSPIIGGVEEMMRIGLYMNDLGLHDTSREMALSGIKPLPQLEMARDHEFDKGKALEENIEKLAIERRRSEELLYRMMPKAIADRLRLGGKAVETCEYFDNVTVMFSYLDGFVSICSQVKAMEIVNLVNTMFTTLDNLTDMHDVYKCETLGDAMYMTVSGAPVKKLRHAEPMSGMALDTIKAVKSIRNPANNKPMTVTIGMHSGPVAAGLVGEKTPQYCLFGDTVNIASRLRTTSLPMRIHISETTKHCLENTNFQIEFRGVVELKGKGKTRTYWLIGKKENLT
ncbi:soluble guanylate cyclase 88E-like [Acropora muricata]|uniref:soluble guanylate cyclase 88E-like n=1 Tax=Acropora muricata TaxID=159855 RepID=UPI0034E476D4